MDCFSLQAFALIFFSFCVRPSPPLAVADPGLVLLSLKFQISDPLGSLSSWDNNNNGSLNYCDWRGVTCGRRHPLHVVALDLDSLGLFGPIPPIISNLTFLTRLDLSDNHFEGRIPPELGRLSRLQYLNLSVNLLEGEIPAAISRCSHLEIISLRDNKLSGTIPSNLTRCFNLRTLSFRDNMIGGEIPADIASLPILRILSLGDNNLIGRIPLLLGSIPSLVYVGLYNNSLSGSIPPFLGNSSTLQSLFLSGNALDGEIPPSLGNSTALKYVNLRSNTLTGEIPPWVGNCTSLIHLNLDENGLSGVLPPFLMNPSPLILFSVESNDLTGGIPPSLGNLSSLEALYLSLNRLEGSIPESLGKIYGLQYLDLSINNLSNEIPSSLYNLSAISYLRMENNNLSGRLPWDMGLTFPYLQTLALSWNQFEGPIPVSLTANASGLVFLDLEFNQFTGAVPSNLGSLWNLLYLAIGGNRHLIHDWSFLSSLANCSILKRLSLESSNLEGPLPSSFRDLSPALEYLLLGNNKLSGAIPVEIGNFVNLTILDMDQNNFSGSIPASIGGLRNLQYLDLSRNKLSGAIPAALGNIGQLNQLYLQENELNGTIPAAIGGCSGLALLNLSHNAIGGTIPIELVSIFTLTQYVDLSHNFLVGSIPFQVGLMINLGSLNVSENRLSGDIPPTLGACLSLEQLHMEGNFLQGNIPPSFKNLTSLTKLDLSRNKLSGPIPQFIAESLGSLRSLNLSFNDFEGQVPSGGVFSNASDQISLLGNKKLCGDPELQLPSCFANATNHRRHVVPLKVIISVVAAIIILLLCFFGIILYWRRRKQGCLKVPSPASFFDGERYKKVSYADIYKATDRFSSANLLGSGSFGSVYKGKMDSEENIVAVKVINLYRKGASRSFTIECEALRNVRHRNLVKIITVCSSMDHRDNDFKALVFEYMPNGSLEKWLHPEIELEQPRPPKLTLIQRLNVAIDVASALEYLHHNCQPPVVHCDLKPGNVLLNNDMTAHVGDFGLARFLSKTISATSKGSNSLMGMKGSIGYIAPEYGMGDQVSTQGDVYSFGVLLLEMLTGKKPTDDVFQDGLTLRRYVEMAFPEGVDKILDPLLVLNDVGEVEGDNSSDESTAGERSRRCLFSLVKIGLICSNDAPRERMEMSDVAAEVLTIKREFSMV